MILRIVIASFITALFAQGVSAQSFENYQQREKDLLALAAIFGEMHQIRRHCEPRYESDIWRERMKKLVELEEPEAGSRNRMVASFNDAYRKTQNRFIGCDRRARDYAASRAEQGDRIVSRLTAPLIEAMAQEENMPLIIQTGEPAIRE